MAGQYVDYNCVLPISKAMIILLAEYVVYFLIALYFDNVLANESGVRRRPWCGRRAPRRASQARSCVPPCCMTLTQWPLSSELETVRPASPMGRSLSV